MLLSFPKFCGQFTNFRYIFSLKFNLVKINVNAIQFKLCSSFYNKEERVLLEELNNLEVTRNNFNVEKLDLLMHEISIFKDRGKNLPEYIKLIDVRDILECETQTQKLRYLTYLFKKEQIKLKSVGKKLKSKIERENRKIEVPENNHIQYGLGKNSLILRTLKRSMVKYYDKKLANAVLFGQKIVIDLGYDKYMTTKEKKGCISQIKLLYSVNRCHHDPYDLYICNANSESRCLERLRYDVPNIDDTLVTVTEKSYLDLFPKENLFYLSPHAPETLMNYDHNAVYIIGGFVDTVKRKDISFSKAQEEGIKSYRLPLDEFAVWKNGTKSLTINQVFSILQTKKHSDDWIEALKHLPTRKLKRVDVNSDTAELYSDKLYAIDSN